MPDKLSRRRRRASFLLAGGLAAVAATVMLLIAGFISNEKASSATLAAAEEARADARAAFTLLEAVSRMELSQRTYITTASARTRASYVAHVQQTETALTALEARVTRDEILHAP
ncbi:MAG: hypothetical protein AB7O04_16305, partial [Hyphomonadaceae bacterium]